MYRVEIWCIVGGFWVREKVKKMRVVVVHAEAHGMGKKKTFWQLEGASASLENLHICGHLEFPILQGTQCSTLPNHKICLNNLFFSWGEEDHSAHILPSLL